MGSSETGTAEEARQRFLRPLARLLIGGLGGSDDHATVYLDERLRYVADGLSPQDRRSLFLDHLAIEIPAIAQLVSDQFDPEIAREILTGFHAPLTDRQEPKVKVLFIGDCLFVETRAFLAPVMERGDCPIETSHVFFSAAQQVESMNDAVIKEIARWQPDVIGVSLFTFEGFRCIEPLGVRRRRSSPRTAQPRWSKGWWARCTGSSTTFGPSPRRRSCCTRRAGSRSIRCAAGFLSLPRTRAHRRTPVDARQTGRGAGGGERERRGPG